MTSKILRIAATIVLVCAPSFAYAQPHGGGGHPGGGGGGGGHPQGGGGARPAPAAPPASMIRQAPAQAPIRQAPVAAPIRQGPPAGNFNLNHDIAPEQRAVPIARPATVARPVTATRPITSARTGGSATAARAGRPASGQNARPTTIAGRGRNGAKTSGNYRRAPVTAEASGGRYRGHFNGQPIANRRSRGGHWGWNHGSRWNAASGYWGGGFWGDFALASIGGFALYGSIDDSQNGYTYDSYRVDADTPGAELLNDYQLEQAECGPPGLVDIWGPDGSVICAVPNDDVPPGDYQVDPETFTLVPAT